MYYCRSIDRTPCKEKGKEGRIRQTGKDRTKISGMYMISGLNMISGMYMISGLYMISGMYMISGFASAEAQDPISTNLLT
jgi:hypothetical protein